MSKMILPERKSKSCQNCGHGHHDGALWIQVRDYGTDDEPYSIKACDTCTCDDCTKMRLAKNKS